MLLGQDKAKALSRGQRYRANNRQKRREHTQRWKRNNPEKVALQRAREKAKRLAAKSNNAIYLAERE